MINLWELIHLIIRWGINYYNNNYSINQIKCYILIIPGFGMISTVISAGSSKSVFGYILNSPLIYLFYILYLLQQTICKEVKQSLWFILPNTLFMLNFYISLVKILVMNDNPQITKARTILFKLGIKEFSKLSMLVGIPEAIRLFLTYFLYLIYFIGFIKYNIIYKSLFSHNYSTFSGKDKDENFYEWLAGFIDGGGCFLLSKKGYASLEIVIQLRDKKCLYLIKQKFGGSIKLCSGDNYLRYRLHNKKGLLALINKVNGLLQNPIRILQLGKICEAYNIQLKDPKPLTYYNGWLAGFFDTDGSIYLNDQSGQIFITATQKNKFILDILTQLYGGTIYPMVKQGAFKWTCFKKKEVLSLVDNYFLVNPCRSEKMKRIFLVQKFYELRKLHAHSALPNSDLGKAWKHFLIKWNSLLS